MFKEIIRQIKPAVIILFLFTLITGLLYPMLVTGIAQVIFPWEANGSLLAKNGNVVGSLLIGQAFSDPHYFYSRPSATSPVPYNGESSSGSNLGPSNPTLLAAIKERASHFQKTDSPIPVDLVTASGSGLDPDISPAAAFYQVARIAKLRKLPESEINQLVERFTQKRQFALLGEPRINVLELNLALDELRKTHA